MNKENFLAAIPKVKSPIKPLAAPAEPIPDMPISPL